MKYPKSMQIPKIDVYRWERKEGLTVAPCVEIHVNGVPVPYLQGWALKEQVNEISTVTLELVGDVSIHEGKPGGTDGQGM